MKTMIMSEEWPGKDNWMKKKPLGMGDLLGRTSERHYNKQTCIEMILNNLSPNDEYGIAKNLPIDMLYDFKIHFKGMFRIRYRGKSDYNRGYFRAPNHCLQKYATSFAIYPKNDEGVLMILKESK